MNFKKKRWILSLLLLSIIIRLISFKNHAIWWDSSVYLNMGKYMFSMGKVGLWESVRPVIWPFVLGLFWKMGFDSILLGKILTLILSVSSIFITYLIGKEVFDEKIGLISALFLSVFPTFLFNNTLLITGIPSTFLALLGVYFFLKERLFLTGLFTGLAFMTRFLQLGVIIVVGFVFFLTYLKKEGFIKKAFTFASGSLLIIVPYLILNQALYNNFLHPFLMQIHMTANTGWMYHQGWAYYFILLIRENALSVFFVSGMIFVLFKMNHKKLLIVLLTLFFFFYFTSIPHKEARFIITFLPYLCILFSYGLFMAFKPLWSRKRVKLLLIFLLLLWAVQEGKQVHVPQPPEWLSPFQEYFKVRSTDGLVWISNPMMVLYSDDDNAVPIYYPAFNTEMAISLKNHLFEADHILFDTCDLLCYPDDIECFDEKDKLISDIKLNFEERFYQVKGNCELGIFFKNFTSQMTTQTPLTRGGIYLDSVVPGIV